MSFARMEKQLGGGQPQDAPYAMSVAQRQDTRTIYLSGEIDFSASLKLIPELDQITRDGDGELLFDLGSVTVLDSEGIKMLLTAFDRVRERNGKASIVCCSDRARRVIQLAGVEEFLYVSGDPDASPPTRRTNWNQT